MDITPVDITIPETILLLGIDDETGKPVVGDERLRLAFAVGAIAQLTMLGRVRLAQEGEAEARPGTFVAADGAVDERLEALVELIDGKQPSSAISHVLRFGGPGAPAMQVRQRMLADFAEEGVLARQEQRFLGMTWSERWERGERREVEDAVQARARALLQGRAQQAHEGAAAGDAIARLEQRDHVLAAALAILHSAEALPKVFPDLPKEQVEAAGSALASDDWASEAVRGALQQLEAVMITVLVAGVITTTTSS
ncbi:GOLPH3/VPS74 family protein [Agrococcus sp. Marseille-P2731]|uniref:GOLPH3/VPS74 family protein n=1 Tax=Agrococcus sp. Marseille-P2731 TaxID=1841862 RepID=UPI0009310E3D|nr:GPP34 family phosphoprotein [Agrococcus sp. Marseille-P2731]